MASLLAGKTALVGGSSRGIGRGIALVFLTEGANVLLTGRDAASLDKTRAELEQDFGRDRVAGFAGDLTKRDVCGVAVDSVLRRWHRLDIVVANVGTGRGTTGWRLTDGDWESMLAMNLMAGVKLIESALPPLIEAGRGSILAIASIAALEAMPAPMPYSAAKAALLAYIKNLSRQVGPNGVRVNAIAPGNVIFPGGTWDKKRSENEAETRRYIEAEVPLRRFGQPEEIGHAAAFLASDRASFITGACLTVDGGQTRTG